jgi:Trypsin
VVTSRAGATTEEDVPLLKLKAALVGVVGLLLVAVTPASAITYGQEDGTQHPYVGFMISFVPSEPGWFSCSGTLLNSTTFLTAGHCTVDIGTNGAESGRSGGNDVWVTTEPNDVLGGWPARADYPDEATLYAARSAWLNANSGFIRGTSHPDPLYADFAQFPVNNDLGIVTLSSPSSVREFGVLAPLGTVERLASKPSTRNNALIETVGYGTQSVEPKPMDVATRYRSTSRIVELNGHISSGGNLHTLNNPSPIGGVGGSCFGDSGGPLFVPGTNQVVAVVSFGNSLTCHGADYSWRVDIASSQAFITGFLD